MTKKFILVFLLLLSSFFFVLLCLVLKRREKRIPCSPCIYCHVSLYKPFLCHMVLFMNKLYDK